MTQIFQRWDGELTFGTFDTQSGNLHAVEDLTDMVHVFFEGVREHNNVVHVDKAERVTEASKDSVNHVLERRWRVFETKRHLIVLVETVRGDECRFAFIRFADADLPKSPTEVHERVVGPTASRP